MHAPGGRVLVPPVEKGWGVGRRRRRDSGSLRSEGPPLRESPVRRVWPLRQRESGRGMDFFLLGLEKLGADWFGPSGPTWPEQLQHFAKKKERKNLLYLPYHQS